MYLMMRADAMRAYVYLYTDRPAFQVLGNPFRVSHLETDIEIQLG